jgi:hypothetical protein
MSYSLYAYAPSVKASHQAGADLDSLEEVEIPENVRLAFVEKLGEFGYRLNHQDEDSEEYVHDGPHGPIEVMVFDSEISASVPYWDDSSRAIDEAARMLTQLASAVGLSVYDPQTDTWIA